MAKKDDGQIFPTDAQGNIIPGTYQTPVGGKKRYHLSLSNTTILEVKIKKIEPAKHYDVLSFARAMNDDFASKTKELFSSEVEAVNEAIECGTLNVIMFHPLTVK